jgi:hypothetical protein
MSEQNWHFFLCIGWTHVFNTLVRAHGTELAAILGSELKVVMHQIVKICGCQPYRSMMCLEHESSDLHFILGWLRIG